MRNVFTARLDSLLATTSFLRIKLKYYIFRSVKHAE